MKLRKSLALLLFPLFIQQVMAQNTPECPSEEQIKYIKIIRSEQNPMGEWVFFSAPFQANGATWEISFIQYSSSGIHDAQYTWDHTKIGGPLLPEMCDYYAPDWNSRLNWISASQINK